MFNRICLYLLRNNNKILFILHKKYYCYLTRISIYYYIHIEVNSNGFYITFSQNTSFIIKLNHTAIFYFLCKFD